MHQDIRSVWKRLVHPEYVAGFMGTLGMRSAFRYRVEGAAATQELRKGDVVTLETRSGKRVVDLTVDDSAPPSFFALVNSGKDGRRVDKFVLKVRFKLTEYGEGRTKVSVSCAIILMSQFREIVALLAPTGLIYGFLIGRALKKLGK